jgi:hypothetical protein
MSPWWTDPQAGLVGGIGGSVVGVLGGTLGTVAGICAPRGKCKWLVYGLAAFLMGTGIISLIAGVAAVLLHQPYGVYYPLILLGFISTVGMGGLLPVIRLRYRQADNRRLDAEEFRRS